MRDEGSAARLRQTMLRTRTKQVERCEQELRFAQSEIERAQQRHYQAQNDLDYAKQKLADIQAEIAAAESAEEVMNGTRMDGNAGQEVPG